MYCHGAGVGRGYGEGRVWGNVVVERDAEGGREVGGETNTMNSLFLQMMPMKVETGHVISARALEVFVPRFSPLGAALGS